MQSEGPFEGIETCAIGPDGPPEIVVWGDSHLRAMMDGIGLAALEANTPGILIWHAGCPPLFGISKQESAATAAEDAACAAANGQLQTAFATLGSATRVLLVGRWTYYSEGAGTGKDAHNTIRLSPTGSSASGDVPQWEIFEAALARTAEILSENFETVYIARQVPEIPNYDSRYVAKALAPHGRLTDAELTHYTHVAEEILAARGGQCGAADPVSGSGRTCRRTRHLGAALPGTLFGADRRAAGLFRQQPFDEPGRRDVAAPADACSDRRAAVTGDPLGDPLDGGVGRDRDRRRDGRRHRGTGAGRGRARGPDP